MTKDDAIKIIEKVSGFTDEDSMVREAWKTILTEIARLEAEIRELKPKTDCSCSYCVQARLLENYTTHSSSKPYANTKRSCP